MKIPKHLTHKPIIVVEDYNDDYLEDYTDVKGLSLGFSTWDANDISVKIWRRPNNRWSRQSEELPIHRAIDLSILAISSALIKDGNSTVSISSLSEKIVDKDNFDDVFEYFKTHKESITDRIKELNKLINLYLETNE